MNTHIQWPDVKASIFKMQGDKFDSPTKCYIDHIGIVGFNAGEIALHYQRAANQLIDNLEKGGDMYHPDGLFLPVCYLYRHCLELKLKSLLSVLISCDLAEDNSDLLSRHNLGKLWTVIKPALKKRWPKGDPKPLNNAGALIQDFIKIDKSGQSLRYASDQNGEDVREKFPKIIRLDFLRDSFSGLFNFLDACESCLSDIL